MDWLFDNFQIFLIIGLALAAWIKNRASAKEEEQAERHVREEMTRHLQELDKRPIPKTPPPSPWDTRPQPAPAGRPSPPAIPQKAAVAQSTLQKPKGEQGAYDRQPDPWQEFKHDNTGISQIQSTDQQALNLQHDMQERIAELKRNAAEFRKQVGGARVTQRQLEKGNDRKTGDLPKLSAVLKDRRQIKRAIVLREILGTPLGLR